MREIAAAATKSSIFGQTPPAADKTTEASQRQTTPTGAANATTGGRDNAALVLLAWVLLTGSIAGNGYLFWSYLDIRHKYRLMVRKSARAVGRYSAA